MPRQFEPLSQNDSRWSNVLLGNSITINLGQAGCLVTSFSILSYYYNHPLSPPDMNQKLKDAGLFDGGLISADDDLSKIFPDIVYVNSEHYENGPANLSLLKDLTSDLSKCVIVEIDLGNGIVHFTPVLSCDGTSVTLQNVWDGKVEDLQTVYGDPATKILKYIVYQGTVAVDPAPDTIIEIKQQDFLKLDQKSLELDKVGAGLGFDQVTIDSLNFSDKVLQKFHDVSSGNTSSSTPEATPLPDSPNSPSLTPVNPTLLQKFLALLGLKVG